jgi:hypothetical protein
MARNVESAEQVEGSCTEIIRPTEVDCLDKLSKFSAFQLACVLYAPCWCITRFDILLGADPDFILYYYKQTTPTELKSNRLIAETD